MVDLGVPGGEEQPNVAVGGPTALQIQNGVAPTGAPEPATLVLLAVGLAGKLWHPSGTQIRTRKAGNSQEAFYA